MSFLSGKKFEDALRIILGVHFRKEKIKQAAYELSLGNQVYRTDSESKKREILDDKDSQVIINPGQFSLLLTDESLEIPNKYLGFISIKFNQKIKGLVNVSGFHVDPGFCGKIIFSVYNAGPSPIILDKGKPYFLLWLTTLTSPVSYQGSHQGQSEISADLIEQLRGDLASPNALLANIKDLESRFVSKSDKLMSKRKYLTWLYQALVIVFAGLFITECRKNDQLAIAYQTGFQDGKNKRDANTEVKYFLDSIRHSINADLHMKTKTH